jgi:GH24 family phage-related lysozyme (muramidase)
MAYESKISMYNEAYLQKAIFKVAVEQGSMWKADNYDSIKLHAYNNIGHYKIEVEALDIKAILNKTNGELKILRLDNGEWIPAATHNMTKDILDEKYIDLQLHDEGTRQNDKGDPMYFWQTYIDEKTQETYTFRNVDLGRDIDFINGDKLRYYAPDQALVEQLQNLPQMKVSDEVKQHALKQLLEAGINGATVTGTESYKVNGEPTIFIYAKDDQGRTFNVTYRGSEGLERSTVFVRQGVKEEYTGSFVGQGLVDLESYADKFPEMGNGKIATSKGTVRNPTPLQTLVMWTELQEGLKEKFAKDPYSIGEFKGYLCDAKVKTCGFGSTGAEYRQTMSVNEAFAAMDKHIDYQRASLRSQVGGEAFDKLAPREQDALTSLGYNTGRIGDGLVNLVREYADNPSDANQDKVCDKIMEYCKYRPSKGAELQVASGLQDRRSIEVALFKGEIDELSDRQLAWLVPHSIKDQTRADFKEYYDNEGAGNRPVAKNDEFSNKETGKISDELKQQGMSEYAGTNAYLPQEVMDSALARAQNRASNNLG